MNLYVKVRIGSWGLLLHSSLVAEITEATTSTRTASHGVVLGYRAWRSRKLPVVGLASVLGAPGTRVHGHSIVCFNQDNEAVCYIDTDEVVGVLEIEPERFAPLPPITAQLERYFDRAWVDEGGLTMLRFRTPLAIYDLLA